MREVHDTTGRFVMRPHYEAKELDRECEKILIEFYKKKGADTFPSLIPTDDLTTLIEANTSDFDPDADLSAYGPDVEGLTEFRRNAKSVVRIGKGLAYDENRENRYRTTLTHEFGHVFFHSYLFNFQLRDSNASPDLLKQVCKRDKIIGAASTDWMEWQAGHVCGALLMPASRVKRLASEARQSAGLAADALLRGRLALETQDEVMRMFQVSSQAATIRLKRLNIIP